MTKTLDVLAASVVAALSESGQTLATAESCSGGWIAKLITDIAGSSNVFELGFVTYSNAAKTAQLGVSKAALEQDGAVSATVVAAMADGARSEASANIAVAVSGIAGPGGGSTEKPVGTVYFAWATASGTTVERRQFAGDRDAVRAQTVQHALQGVLSRV